MENPWKIISGKDLYDNPWIKLTEFNVVNPSGGKGIYGKVHFKNIAIGIVALDRDNNIYLVGQHRFTLNSYSWEIPEGGCPENEAPLEAARRELLEETGLQAAGWQELMRLHLSNSVTDELAIVYVAKELTQHNNDLEETEDISTVKIPFSEALNKVLAGEITDAITVAAILKMAVSVPELNQPS